MNIIYEGLISVLVEADLTVFSFRFWKTGVEYCSNLLAPARRVATIDSYSHTHPVWVCSLEPLQVTPAGYSSHCRSSKLLHLFIVLSLSQNIKASPRKLIFKTWCVCFGTNLCAHSLMWIQSLWYYICWTRWERIKSRSLGRLLILSFILAQKSKLLQMLHLFYDHETFSFCRTSHFFAQEAEESHNGDANHETTERGGR